MNKLNMRTLPTAPFILFLALLAGCSSTNTNTPPPTVIQDIEIQAEAGANRNTATALDIVFVYDAAALSLLPKTGPGWFDKKTALTNGLALSIDVISLQIPPAMVISVPLPSRAGKAIGVYSYANYLGINGQPAGNLTPYKKMAIRLTPDTIVYSGNPR